LRVVIIPEDSGNDRYILNPIVEAMIESAGKPHAKILIYEGRKPHGIAQVLRWERIKEIVDSYPQVDLFLLIVDRDGEEDRQVQLRNIERQAAAILPADRCFLAAHAWQEVEVWGLAGCTDLPNTWQWQSVRSERDPKQRYFIPYIQGRGLVNEPGGGRKTLGREAANRYNRIRQRCNEIVELEGRIRAWIDSSHRR
jgi:hypothetical protein